MMEGPGADSEEKHEPVSDIDTAVVVVGLKALDPEWPIREANDAVDGAHSTASMCQRVVALKRTTMRGAVHGRS
jgi:hypothetical protein